MYGLIQNLILLQQGHFCSGAFFLTELKSGGPGDGGGAPLIDSDSFQLPLNR